MLGILSNIKRYLSRDARAERAGARAVVEELRGYNSAKTWHADKSYTLEELYDLTLEPADGPLAFEMGILRYIGEVPARQRRLEEIRINGH